MHGLLALEVEGGEEPERPGIVHRLDRDTSGLLVVARSQEAHRRLQELVRERAVERAYLALVCGRPRSQRSERTSSTTSPTSWASMRCRCTVFHVFPRAMQSV